MNYNQLKPDPGPSPALDAPTIQGNFEYYGNLLSDNHIAMNEQFQGNHSDIIFESQLKDPGVTTNLTVLYSKLASSQSGSQPELFVQIPTFLPTALDTTPSAISKNTPMRLSYSSVGTAGPIFYSFLPGGYVIYWGTASLSVPKNSTASTTVTISPIASRILIAIAVPITQVAFALPNSLPLATNVNNNSSFTIYVNGNSTNATITYDLLWFAIGNA